MDLKNIPTWGMRTIIGAGTLAGVLMSFFTLQKVFDDRLKEEFSTQSTKIITEIQDKANTLADFQKDDLWDRIQLLETEIEARKESGKVVPERMRIHIRSMRERYKEMKNPWDD